MAIRQELLVFSLLLLVRISNSFSLRHVMDRLNALEMKFEIENRLRRSETEECFRRISEMNTGRKVPNADELVPTDDMTPIQQVTAVMSSTDSNKTSNDTFDYQILKSYVIKGVKVEKQVNTIFRKELEHIVNKLKTDNSIFENVIKEEIRNFTEKVSDNQKSLVSVQQLDKFSETMIKQTDDKIYDVRTSLLSLKSDMDTIIPNIKKEMRNFTEKVTENHKSLVSAERFYNFSELVMKQCDNKIDDVRKSLISLKSDMEIFIQNINNELSKLNESLIQVRNAIQFCRILQKSQSSGVYYMHNVNIATGFSVFCDQLTEGGGWTVIQRRLDGSVDFERTWADYKTGFGYLNGEFWLGNDNIHALTSAGFNELRIDMEDFEGNRAYAKYSKFHIKSESDNYALEISGYSGNAGDSLNAHNGSQFSTTDRDNDQYSGSCSIIYRGAWWFTPGCHSSNLNGYYFRGANSPSGQGVVWYHWKSSFDYSLKFVEMKIR